MVDQPTEILTGNLALGYETGWDDSGAVTITRMLNGATQTNVNRPPLRVMKFRGTNMTYSDMQAIEAFKRRVGGRAESFLFRDYGHYQLTNHTILTASGGEDSVQVREVFGSYTWDIRHIVSGTLTLYINGSPYSDFTESNGLLTFTLSPPPLLGGETVSVDCEFYTPVRFVSPLSSMRLMLTHGQISDLDLEEALGE